MSTVSNISFCGQAINQSQTNNCPNSQVLTTNFKGYPADSYESSNKKHPGRTILGTLAVVAGAIALMGYSHKAGWLNNLKDGKFKNGLDTVTGKCHDWCHWTKEKSIAGWDRIKGLFNKEKNA